MSRLKIVSYQQMESLLLRLGFEKKRQKGSHVFFRHPDGRTTTVPNHKAEIFPALSSERSCQRSTRASTNSCAWSDSRIGIHAPENRMHIHDRHAIILHPPGHGPRAADLLQLRPQLPADRCRGKRGPRDLRVGGRCLHVLCARSNPEIADREILLQRYNRVRAE